MSLPISFHPLCKRSRIPLVAAVLLSMLSVSATADDVKAHFDKGVALYKANKNDAALAEFELAHKEAPKDATVLFWLGFINLQEQKFEEARDPLEQAVKLSPNTPEAHLNLGNVYDGLRRYPEAAQEFQTVTKLQPKSADAYYNLGSVYYKMRHLPEAITAYRHAASLSPTDPFIQDGLGFALQASGDFQAALPAYEKATKLDSQNATFWSNYGLAALGMARKAQAANDRKAADSALETARIALAHAVQLHPDDYQIRETYAETLFDMGRDNDAVAQFNKAAELDPKQFNPVYNLGLVEARLNKQADAATAFQRARELRPQSKEALHGLGFAQFKQGKYADAAKTYEELTKLAPDDLTGWINLSSSLKSSGDADGALAALEEAEKHGGSGARMGAVHRALAAAYYKKGDADGLKRAQDEYNASLQGEKENAEALNGLGLISAKQNKYDDAIGYFKRAVAANPRFADAYNNLGVAYEAKKMPDDAKKAYRQALQIDPRNQLAQKNLARFTKSP